MSTVVENPINVSNERTGWGSSFSDQDAAKIYSKNKLMQIAKVNEVMPYLVRWIGSSTVKKALDVGSGDGEITMENAKRLQIPYIVGVDVSPSMAAHATEHFGTETKDLTVKFQHQDATKLNFDSEFDLIISFNALHWVPLQQHETMLCGFRKALVKPGGKMVIEMEAEHSMQALFDCLIECARSPKWRNLFPADFSPAIERPNPLVYEDIMRKAGFSEVKVEVIQHVSKHAGYEGLLSRLNGAWTNIPNVASALKTQENKTKYAQDVATLYTQKYPPDSEGNILLDNLLLLAQAVA